MSYQILPMIRILMPFKKQIWNKRKEFSEFHNYFGKKMKIRNDYVNTDFSKINNMKA